MYKIKTDMNYLCLVQNKRKLLKKKPIPTMCIFPSIMHLQNGNKYELFLLMAGILHMLCKHKTIDQSIDAYHIFSYQYLSLSLL